MEKAKIIATVGYQWLVLAEEGEQSYTNYGDGRQGDTSELVAQVNGDSALGLGYSDWRLPTKEEIESLIRAESAPNSGWYWSFSPYVGNSVYAWGVAFGSGLVGINYRNYFGLVRLVRATQ